VARGRAYQLPLWLRPMSWRDTRLRFLRWSDSARLIRVGGALRGSPKVRYAVIEDGVVRVEAACVLEVAGTELWTSQGRVSRRRPSLGSQASESAHATLQRRPRLDNCTITIVPSVE
jgi:hypothetical protein